MPSCFAGISKAMVKSRALNDANIYSGTVRPTVHTAHCRPALPKVSRNVIRMRNECLCAELIRAI